MKRVLVCGGRNYADQGRVEQVLAEFEPSETMLINGGASGADDLAFKYAKSRRWREIETYFADWERHGRAAGMIRNREMLMKGAPDIVIAFPGGKGTAGMVEIARAAKVTVRKVDW